MSRCDGRKPQELRKIKFKKNFIKNADASCLVEWGNTKVLCTATLEEKVPPFKRNSGEGWVTAEYGMLPASCSNRIIRPAAKGKIPGRTYEIQRLIGRSLRAVVDFKKLGERSIWIDCDVLQGDGGTRTASITGGYVAMGLLVKKMLKEKIIQENILNDSVAAVSLGIKDSKVLLDLCYEEDSSADVDMNVVMTGSEQLIEVQGTAEGAPFSFDEMNTLLKVARKGINEIKKMQEETIGL